MKSKNCIIPIFVVLTLTTTIFSLDAQAQSCTRESSTEQNVGVYPHTPSGHLWINNGFAHYTKLWCYSNSYWINKYWSGYGFVKSTWQSGYGYGESCSYWYKPIHRVLSAMRFIDYVSSIYVNFGGATTWDNMARNNIDTTSAKCAHSNGTRHADMDLFSNLTIYMAGIYNEEQYVSRKNTVGELAALIVHESRHGWHKHNGLSRCDSCDYSWTNSQVIRHEIRFLWDVYTKSPFKSGQNIGPSNYINRNNIYEYHLSEPQLDLMRDRGNYRIATRFVQTPNFRIAPRAQPWILSEK